MLRNGAFISTRHNSYSWGLQGLIFTFKVASLASCGCVLGKTQYVPWNAFRVRPEGMLGVLLRFLVLLTRYQAPRALLVISTPARKVNMVRYNPAHSPACQHLRSVDRSSS
jgi:hypothetical protein